MPFQLPPLDSPRWSQLRHAYGPALDTPIRLREAATASAAERHDSEPWFSLWSSLCHQSDVYNASYAASPHLIQIAANSRGRLRSEPLHLAVAIEICRHRGQGPTVPDDLQEMYTEAWKLVPRLAEPLLSEPWDPMVSPVLFGALAVAKGRYELGILAVDSEAPLTCPSCGETRGFQEFELSL